MPLFSPSIIGSVGGNTTGTTQSQNGGTLMFAGGSNMTISGSTDAAGNQTLSFNGGAGGGGGGGINATLAGNTSGVLALISSDTMTLAGGNNVTLSQAGNAITISGASQIPMNVGVGTQGLVFGTTGSVSQQMLHVATDGLYYSQSILGQAASLTVGIPGLNYASPFSAHPMAITSYMRNSSMYFSPFQLSHPLTMSRCDFIGSFSHATSTSGTTSGSLNFSAGIYSLNGSTLSLAVSGSQQYTWSNTSNAGTSLYIVAQRKWSVPLATTLQPGNYWFAHNYISANAGSFSIQGNTAVSNQIAGDFGVASATSVKLTPFYGAYNTTVTTALPSAVQQSEINGFQTGARWYPHVIFANNTY